MTIKNKLNWFKEQQTWSLVLFLLLFVVAVHIIVGRVFMVFSQCPDIGGSMEPVFGFFVQRILAGETYFPNPSEPPYVISQYTPIFFHTAALVARIFNVDPTENVMQVFWAGRAVNMLANIFTFVFLTKAVGLFRKITVNEVLAILIIYLGTLTSHNMATRPDSMKTMFIVMGLYYFLKYQFSGRPKLYLISAILFSLAVLSKQDAIIEYTVFVLVHFVLLSRNKGREVLTSIATFAVFIVTIQLLFHGQHLDILFIKTKELISLEYLQFISWIYARQLYVYGGFFVVVLLVYFFEPDKSRIRYLFATFLIIAVYNLFSLSFFGSAFVYLSTSLILAILLMSSWTYGRYLLYAAAFFIIFYNIKDNADYRYNIYHKTAYNEKFVPEHEIRKEISDYLRQNMDDAQYVLTFEKLLTNYIHDIAVFPTYETEGIQFYYYGDVQFKNFQFIQKFEYNTDFLVENHEPKFMVLHHEKQVDLVYQTIDMMDYEQVWEKDNFRILEHKFYLDEVAR